MDSKAIQAAHEAALAGTHELRSLVDSLGDAAPSAEQEAQFKKIEADIAKHEAVVTRGLAARRAEDEVRSNGAALAGLMKPATHKTETPSVATQFRSLKTGNFTEFRAMGTSTVNSLVQEPVTVNFPAAVVAYARNVSAVIAANANIIRTDNGSAIAIPVVTGLQTGTIVSEAGLIPESDLTGANTTLNAYGFKWLAQLSNELLADEAFDIVQFMTEQSGASFGGTFGAYALTGTGTNQPQGLLTGANIGVTIANYSALSVDNLIDLQSSVLPQYQVNGSFIMNQATYGQVRKLKATGTGNYLLEPAVTAGGPATILGAPVFVDSGMPNGGTTAYPVAYGDVHRAYTIRFAGTLRVDRSDEYAFANDLVTFRFVQRADGKVVDPNAVKTLKTTAA